LVDHKVLLAVPDYLPSTVAASANWPASPWHCLPRRLGSPRNGLLGTQTKAHATGE